MPGLTSISNIPESKITSIATYNSQNNNTALTNFCQPIEDKFQSTDNDEHIEIELREAWKAVIEAAASTPHSSPQKQKIADFILDVQAQPAVEKDGEKCTMHEMRLWTDLPLFGWVMREVWNTDTSDNTDPETKTQWLNLNAWTATLMTSQHTNSVREPDVSNLGLWTIRAALESDQPSNLELAAAAVWFVYASPAIWGLSLQEKTFEGKMAKPGPRFRDRVWRGFSRERWESWLERLGGCEERGLNEETRMLVQKARKAMGEVVKN
ncbi:Hypothetical protein R9X50_00787000 [Acrodontium crateriforme]|uniref:Uncharacterized protein n=1 Tax=Acrodontium crateriforme TaxID=150365 RepID=A0AAQ3MC34_9PEZI|nr:Hypothetical protein R9X50_00787000 [Acrodontium crateriforme]